MTKLNWWNPLAVLGVIAFAAVPASAQSPRARVSGGYLTTFDGGHTFTGGTGDVEVTLMPRLGLVAQVDHTVGDGNGYFSRWDWRDTAVLGGIRVASLQPLAPFAEFLAGVYQSRATETLEARAPASFRPGSYVDRDPVIHVGGGLTLYLSQRFGVRVGAGLQFVPDATPLGRVAVSGTIGLGRR